MQNPHGYWPITTNIVAWQLESYHLDHPSKCFPEYVIDPSVKDQLLEALGFDKTCDEVAAASRLLEIGEIVRLRSEDDILPLLAQRGLSTNSSVAVWSFEYGTLDDTPVFETPKLLEVVFYLYLESASDLYLIERNAEWCLVVHHSGWNSCYLWVNQGRTSHPRE